MQVTIPQDSTNRTTVKTTPIDMIDPQTLQDIRAKSVRSTGLEIQAARTHNTTEITTHTTINNHMVTMEEDMLINTSIAETNPETE